MGNSLFFPTFRLVFVGLAVMAAFAWARQFINVAPTTDMITYILTLFKKVPLWSEDQEQLKRIVENEKIEGDVWYLYHKGTEFALYFTYVKAGAVESFSVYCVTAWGSGLIKANFEKSALVSGGFNDKTFTAGQDPVLQGNLGTILQSMRSLSGYHSSLSGSQQGVTSIG